MNDKIDGICPICKQKCKIDDISKACDHFQGYNCKKCGDYVIPTIVSLLLSNDKDYNHLQQFHPDIGTFDKNILLNAISKAIEKTNHNYKSIYFYLKDEKPKFESDDTSGRILMELDELYFNE